MKTQIDKTKIILDSFELLKEDWENNKSDILKLFDIIFKENTSTGLEMWDYLLNRYSNAFWHTDTVEPEAFLISGILCHYIINVDFNSKQIKILRKHTTIIDKVFSNSNFIEEDYNIYSYFLEKLFINNLKADFCYFLDIILTNKRIQFSGGYQWFDFQNIINIIRNYGFAKENYLAFDVFKENHSPISAIILLELLPRLKKYTKNINDTTLPEIQTIIYSYIENEPDKIYRAKLSAEFLKFINK